MLRPFFFLVLASCSCLTVLRGQVTVTIDFADSTIEGGTLRKEPGHSPEPITGNFRDPWFDEVKAGTASTFTIEDVALIGTLTVTAEALSDDLNVTDDGLSDGPSGYNATGEGTTFLFDRDLTVTAIDFTSFTTNGGDEVTLGSGTQSLGPIGDGESLTHNSLSANFTETNPAETTIPVGAGEPFAVKWSAGRFYVESLQIQTVPEPSRFGLIAGLLVFGLALFSRRRRRRTEGEE